MKVKTLLVLYALAAQIQVFRSAPAGDEENTPKDEATNECSEGDVRLNRITDPDTLYRVNITGDVQGLINICENGVWTNVVLCRTDVTWDDSNTAVACRELGYAAAASFRVHDSLSVVTSRRLSYIPQCTGVENRLSNCSQFYRDHENNDQCPPVIISCWNSTADNSQSSATLTPSPLAPSSHTSDSSPRNTASSFTTILLSPQPLATSSDCSVCGGSGSATMPVVTPSRPLLIPSSAVSSTSPHPSSDRVVAESVCWQSMVYGGLVGGGLVAMAVCIILLAVYFIKRRGNVSSATVSGEDVQVTERNPAYQTTASLIPSSTNPAYAALSGNTQPRLPAHIMYEDVAL